MLFCGEIHLKKGKKLYGIHLDKPLGKNNGVVDGKKYFGPVKDLHGVFVPMSKVSPAKRVSCVTRLCAISDSCFP